MPHDKIRHTLIFRPTRRLGLIVLASGMAGLLGLAALMSTHAAVYHAAQEAEGGMLSGQARAVDDDMASDGQAVRFGALDGPGRSYPLHTGIVATTFWVGEQFQDTADGSQVCSAYDSEWQYSFFHLRTGTNDAVGCNGAPTGGCDALLRDPEGRCGGNNAIGSLRTPENGYSPSGSPEIYENPFYLDLPYDDYNESTDDETTGYSRRCQDIPWADDPGYAGNCTNRGFSYMKNRWVKTMAGGKTCYGQIEDAGPADSGNGNGNYADYQYVFGSDDARPFNQSYNGAGMDISPALGACLGAPFDTDTFQLDWQFVDDADVPDGPWKTIVTSSPPQ